MSNEYVHYPFEFWVDSTFRIHDQHHYDEFITEDDGYTNIGLPEKLLLLIASGRFRLVLEKDEVEIDGGYIEPCPGIAGCMCARLEYVPANVEYTPEAFREIVNEILGETAKK